MSNKENNSVSNYLNKIKSNKYLWPLIVISLIIIGLSKFTNAISDIKDFFTPNGEVKEKTSNIVPDQSDNPAMIVIQNGSKIFNSPSPYPINYQKVKLGSKLSMLKNVYSGNRGVLSESGRYFSVDDGNNIFKYVTYYLEENKEDPQIVNITYRFKNNDMMRKVKSEAVITFDTINFSSSSLGQILHWSDFNGVRIRIDDSSYELISKPKIKLD